MNENRFQSILRYSAWIGIGIFISTVLVNTDLLWVSTHRIRVGLVDLTALIEIFLLWKVCELRNWARITWILLYLVMIPGSPPQLLFLSQLSPPSYLSQLVTLNLAFEIVGFLFGVYMLVYLILPRVRSLFVQTPQWLSSTWTLRGLGIVALALGVFFGKKNMDLFSKWVTL